MTYWTSFMVEFHIHLLCFHVTLQLGITRLQNTGVHGFVAQQYMAYNYSWLTWLCQVKFQMSSEHLSRLRLQDHIVTGFIDRIIYVLSVYSKHIYSNMIFVIIYQPKEGNLIVLNTNMHNNIIFTITLYMFINYRIRPRNSARNLIWIRIRIQKHLFWICYSPSIKSRFVYDDFF